MASSTLTFPQRQTKAGDFIEIGRSGLKRFGGLVHQEFLTTLRNRQGIAVFREMRDNDPVIGASLTILEQVIRKATWFVELKEGMGPGQERRLQRTRCGGDGVCATCVLWTRRKARSNLQISGYRFSWHQVADRSAKRCYR